MTETFNRKREHALQYQALLLLSLAELLSLGLWFSATAALPSLKAEWLLSDSESAWLTMAVQLGFVVGAFGSSLLNLPDIINTRTLIAVSAFLGAATNIFFALFVRTYELAIVSRFFVGLFLSGVYPPGMKLMSTWFKESRGYAIGVLIGALTIGSASPHLFKTFGDLHWQQLMELSALSAILGGIIVLFFVKTGPYATPTPKFDWRAVANVLRDRSTRLANFGYFGHMWELYAMWAWIPTFVLESFGEDSDNPTAAGVAFAVIAAGGMGCILAGKLADRVGRTVVTIWSMAISGICCLLVGFLFGKNPYFLTSLCLLWGCAVVADSAQFSTAITELCDQRFVGTALTFQTAVGFLLTIVSIRLIPVVKELVGWKFAFMSLSIGPLLGILAMARLRQLPEAIKMANGRR